MRFMMIMHPDPKTAYKGDGIPPVDAVAEMTKFNKKLVESGALLSADGLHGPEKGARVRYAGGKVTVTDGPFAESKEIIGGYWMIEARSLEEAVEWARRIPGADGDMVEVRRLFDMSDWPAEIQEAAKI